ncbi:MAG TPA: hypothetical protein VFI28_12795 [Candidatus Limnocylindrales bacterium]|nr:hypothetical protein [Candidatus Limnocylindrales bacterium]
MQFEAIDNEFASIDGVLHARVGRRPKTVVLYTHPRAQSNLTAYPCPELAAAGVDVLAFNNRFTNSPAGSDLATVFEDFALDVGAAVTHARRLGYERVLLMGHSAGGPVMAFYQDVAENGSAAFERDAVLSGFTGFRTLDGAPRNLPRADGLVLRSVTIGTAASFLIRLDGAVIDEATGEVDPALDVYDARNGFDPRTRTATYATDFLTRYYRAQAARMNRLVADAERRLREIDAAQARFEDDDFVVIPRTRANPTTIDLGLAERSMAPALTYPAGRVAAVRDVRPPNPEWPQNRNAAGAAVHRLRALLTYRLVRVDEDRFDPLATTAGASGIDFASSASSTPPSLARIAVPVLIIQGTGDESNSVKIPTAELNRAAAASADCSLVFVEGGMHSMKPVDPSFGDTRAIAVGAIADWIGARFPLD